MRPSIIFFDEIDGLAPVRSSRQDQIHRWAALLSNFEQYICGDCTEVSECKIYRVEQLRLLSDL